MEYTRETRQKLYDKYLTSWKKKLLLASGKTKELAEKMETMNRYYNNDKSFLSDAVRLYWDNGGKETLSQFFQTHYKQLVQAFVDKQYLQDFYTIIDKQNQFP